MFGSANKPTSLFGPSTPGSLFGSKPATTGTSGLFGTPTASSTNSLFGASTATTTAGGNLFGSSTANQSTGGLFGTPATTASTGLFGSTPATTASTGLFGSTPATAASTGLFGSTATSTANTGLFGSKPAGGLFGSGGSTFGFGSAPSTTTTNALFKPFGATTTAPSLFGGATQQQAGGSEEVRTLQSIIANTQALTSAISDPKLFGDDRDGCIALFNQLLAAVGTGKALYEKDKPAVEFNPQNPFYQFRTIGYCALSGYKDRDGIVGLIINESAENYSTTQQRQKLLDGLFSLMGSDPTVHAHVVDVRPVTDKVCEVDIYVTKREVGRIAAKQLFQYFEQRDKRTALEQQLKVLKIVPKIEMDEAYIQQYLNFPPTGFTELEWKEAIVVNPEPKRLLPYPVYGFKDLSERRQRQLVEAELQRKSFDDLASRRKVVNQELQEIDGLRKIFIQDAARLRHRILRVIAVMYAQNTKNTIMSVEEENIRNRIDTLSVCLNAPDNLLDRHETTRNHFRTNKSKLEEVRKEFNSNHGLTKAEADGLRRYLNRRQQDLEALVKTVNKNSEDIELMVNHLR